jgi:hypothetical protein
MLKRGFRMQWVSATALVLFLLLLLSLAVPQATKSRVTYNGRTVEDWLYNSDWEKEKADAEMAIMMLGEKAVDPLRAILHLKSPGWAVSAAWTLPLGDRVLRRPLQNVVKKQNAIECLESVGGVGSVAERLLPDLIAIAEDKREFVRLRQIALRYIELHMPISSEKSNILVRLTLDASLGGDAARYLQSFQRQFGENEIRRLAREIDQRLNERKIREAERFSTNSPFKEHRPLWEAR